MKKTKNNKKDKKIIFAIQPELFVKFKEVCDERCKTISEVLRDFIIQCIGENKK